MVSVADSLVAPMSLINAMIVAVVERKKNDVVDALERLEAVWDEYGIYEKVVD
jgi:DNA-binding MurR/RpiR family transcriptional regulator